MEFLLDAFFVGLSRHLPLLVLFLFLLRAEGAPALPGPPYPKEAEDKRIQGVVMVRVDWDSSGHVRHCEVVKSSGSDLLDDNTSAFIRQHWTNSAMAGKTIQTPIAYRLQAAPGVPARGGPGSLEQLLTGEGFTWTTSLEDARNADIFEVKINGKKFTMTLDTGAYISGIQERAVEDADLTTLPFQLQGDAGLNGSVSGPAQILMVNSFQIGNQMCVAKAMKVSNIAKFANNGITSQGYLGLPFLRANHAVIVVNPPVLFLNPSHAPSAGLDEWLRGRGFLEVPLDFVEDHLIAPVKLDGFPSRMVIDTGAMFSFVNEDFLRQNEIPFQASRLLMQGISGRNFFVGAARLAQVELGGFQFGPTSVTTAPKELFPRTSDGKYLTGLFGYDSLGSAYAVIDTTNNRLYLRAFPVKVR